LDQPFVRIQDANRVRTLYLASLVLTAALEQRHGEGVWRRLIARGCTGGGMSMPQAMVLELGHSTPSELWPVTIAQARPD
jgi:hypothetical protein